MDNQLALALAEEAQRQIISKREKEERTLPREIRKTAEYSNILALEKERKELEKKLKVINGEIKEFSQSLTKEFKMRVSGSEIDTYRSRIDLSYLSRAARVASTQGIEPSKIVDYLIKKFS